MVLLISWITGNQVFVLFRKMSRINNWGAIGPPVTSNDNSFNEITFHTLTVSWHKTKLLCSLSNTRSRTRVLVSVQHSQHLIQVYFLPLGDTRSLSFRSFANTNPAAVPELQEITWSVFWWNTGDRHSGCCWSLNALHPDSILSKWHHPPTRLLNSRHTESLAVLMWPLNKASVSRLQESNNIMEFLSVDLLKYRVWTYKVTHALKNKLQQCFH